MTKKRYVPQQSTATPVFIDRIDDEIPDLHLDMIDEILSSDLLAVYKYYGFILENVSGFFLSFILSSTTGYLILLEGLRGIFNYYSYIRQQGKMSEVYRQSLTLDYLEQTRDGLNRDKFITDAVNIFSLAVFSFMCDELNSLSVGLFRCAIVFFTDLLVMFCQRQNMKKEINSRVETSIAITDKIKVSLTTTFHPKLMMFEIQKENSNRLVCKVNTDYYNKRFKFVPVATFYSLLRDELATWIEPAIFVNTPEQVAIISETKTKLKKELNLSNLRAKMDDLNNGAKLLVKLAKELQIHNIVLNYDLNFPRLKINLNEITPERLRFYIEKNIARIDHGYLILNTTISTVPGYQEITPPSAVPGLVTPMTRLPIKKEKEEKEEKKEVVLEMAGVSTVQCFSKRQRKWGDLLGWLNRESVVQAETKDSEIINFGKYGIYNPHFPRTDLNAVRKISSRAAKYDCFTEDSYVVFEKDIQNMLPKNNSLFKQVSMPLVTRDHGQNGFVLDPGQKLKSTGERIIAKIKIDADERFCCTTYYEGTTTSGRPWKLYVINLSANHAALENCRKPISAGLSGDDLTVQSDTLRSVAAAGPGSRI